MLYITEKNYGTNIYCCKSLKMNTYFLVDINNNNKALLGRDRFK